MLPGIITRFSISTCKYAVLNIHIPLLSTEKSTLECQSYKINKARYSPLERKAKHKLYPTVDKSVKLKIRLQQRTNHMLRHFPIQ